MSTSLFPFGPDGRYHPGQDHSYIPNLGVLNTPSSNSGGISCRTRRLGGRYTRGQALLLCYEEVSSESKTFLELKKLQSVLERRFNYGTRIEYLTSSEDDLESQTGRIIATFVGLYEDRKTLLVVYCVGHGSRTEDFPGYVGLLYPLSNFQYLMRSRDPTLIFRTGNLSRIIWEITRRYLKPTSSDVLEISDR